jgi:hypothetical protein
LPDPASVRDAVRGNLNPASRDRYIFEAILDSTGTVHGFVKGLYCALDVNSGSNIHHGIAMVGYIMMRRESRGSLPLIRSLFLRFQDRAEEAARELGGTLLYFAGEAVPEVEPLLNRFGLSRCYLEMGPGQFEEFKYFQPPLRWDPDTGHPLPGAQAAPEHFMIGTTSGIQRLSRTDLLAAVRAFHYYVDGKFWPQCAFSSESAFRTSRGIAQALAEQMSRQFGCSDAAVLLTRKQRHQLESAGVTIVGHIEADLRVM